MLLQARQVVMWLSRRVQVGRTVGQLKLPQVLLHRHQVVSRSALAMFLKGHQVTLKSSLERVVLQTEATFFCLQAHRLQRTAKVALCDCQLALEAVVAALLFHQVKDLLCRAARYPCRAAPARLVQAGHFNLCLPIVLLVPVVLLCWVQGLLMQAILVPFHC